MSNQKQSKASVNPEVPTCIGVIVDGNRRWAKKKGLPILHGHRAGYRRLKDFVGWAQEAGIRYVIAYIFSSENWNRSKEEVDYLMELIASVLSRDIRTFKQKRMRIKVVGDIERLPPKVQTVIQKAEKETASMKDLTIVLALSYGGRDEIIHALNTILSDREKFKNKNVTKNDFEKYLWTAGIPDPDLIIRTSGEMRLSNFLTWQSVYSELFFVKKYWPDITKHDLIDILKEYRKRNRSYGV